MRGLTALQRSLPTKQLAQLLNNSMTSLWTVARNPSTGLFGTEWSAAPPDGKQPQYIGQNIAAVMAIGLYAQLTCDADIWQPLPAPTIGASVTVTVEAEEALLQGVGIQVGLARQDPRAATGLSWCDLYKWALRCLSRRLQLATFQAGAT